MRESIVETQTLIPTYSKVATLTMEATIITHSSHTVTWVEELEMYTVSVIFKETEIATQRVVVYYKVVGIPIYFTTRMAVPLYVGTRAPPSNINATMLIGLVTGGAAVIAIIVMIAVSLVRKSRDEVSSGYSGYSIEEEWDADVIEYAGAAGNGGPVIDLNQAQELWAGEDDWILD